MTWDPVAWFLGGGAQHSPEVARLLAFAATSAAEGIVTPGDLKVVPLATPGSSVRVLAGACLILNRAAGGAQQTYVARNISEDVKGIAATGTGSGRNDLVIAQIKDPFMPGEPWADPADVTVGPYIFTEVVPNVPTAATATPQDASAYLRTQGITGIPLAAVILPANSSVVGTAQLKDLRRLALPREKRVTVPLYTLDPQILTTVSPSWQEFPTTKPLVDVPEWATHAHVTITVAQLVQEPNAVNRADLVAQLGDKVSPGVQVNIAAGPQARSTVLVSSEVTVSHLAGTTTTVKMIGRRTNTDVAPGSIALDIYSQVIFDVTFSERVV